VTAGGWLTFCSRIVKASSLAAVLSGCLVSAQDARAPMTPVSKDEVRNAIAADLRARGVPGDELPPADDIELPAAVPAAAGHSLRVAASCWDSSLARAQFRIECREAAQCLTFFAYVRWAPPAGRLVGQSCQGSANVRRANSAARKAVVRPGDRATVVFQGTRMRLTSVVTCLDRGAEGDVIRVRNQDGHISRARVSTANLLEALP